MRVRYRPSLVIFINKLKIKYNLELTTFFSLKSNQNIELFDIDP